MPSDIVRAVREAVEEEHPPPPACITKIFQAGRLLLDETPVAALEAGQPIFAVVARETRLEVLLQAAGSCGLYEEMLREAKPEAKPEAPRLLATGPSPSILEVLEEMAGQPLEVPDLRAGASPSMLEFSGRNGQLLVPSLDTVQLLHQHGVDSFEKVTLCVEVNSDAYNRGLGVVLEASPLMDSSVDEHGLPMYVYNGLGISSDKKQNAVKFHPGMRMGQLRIEGLGGWGNQSIGFTPAGWTASGKKLHTLKLTFGADGNNLMSIEGTETGQLWSKPWKRQLTEGRHTPAIYAWLDLGDAQPLHVGQIKMQFHLPARAAA